MELIFTYSLMGCIILGIISHVIAKQKGYNNGFWWGFFLNIIGIIVVACRTDKRLLEGIRHNTITQDNNNLLNMWTCPECGANIPETESQCPACGCKEWICSSCHHTNKASSSFCSKCGKAVVPSIKCPKCGAKNHIQNHNCVSCGSFLRNWYCKWCNASNDYDAEFCRKCGKPKDFSFDNLSSEYHENGTCDLCGASHCYVKTMLVQDNDGLQRVRTVCQVCADNSTKLQIK